MEAMDLLCDNELALIFVLLHNFRLQRKTKENVMKKIKGKVKD